MHFGVRGATFALLSIIATIFLAGCETTGSSPVAATGSSSAIANNPNPDLPANYRNQIANFMRTQRGDAFGLVPFVIRQGETVEIGDPNRRLTYLGMETVVCVRISRGDGWPNNSATRVYSFSGGQLSSGPGQGGLVSGGPGVCGWNTNYKPFPEVKPTPQA
jgi:ABC-type Fe3+-hydroxamate transport system substrate-binding protein